MSSKIEQLIDEIEEYIDSCKPQFMSSTNIIVNKDEIEELLRELRMRTPEEIKRYQKIISNKEAILNDARTKAENMINEATAQTTELVSEHEIMQQAYEQANSVVSDATAQAQSILDNATMEANAVKAAAMQYMDDMLAHLENVIFSANQAASTHYDNLISSLNHYQEIIQSNRSELHPEDSEAINEGLTEEDSAADLDVL
ncbi:MAG: vacuolar family H+-ATPase subunit H [Lachnospiraceae bacterium]|nr:vacuolar family H+-ATPase subunit H [Lachnospiraceae bacterium]